MLLFVDGVSTIVNDRFESGTLTRGVFDNAYGGWCSSRRLSDIENDCFDLDLNYPGGGEALTYTDEMNEVVVGRKAGVVPPRGVMLEQTPAKHVTRITNMTYWK